MNEQEKFIEQRERIIKAFETLGLSTERVSKMSEKQTDAVSALFEAITQDKNGLICAVDDLIMEIQGLRQDLRAVAKAQGIMGLSALFGGRKQRG